MNDISSLKVLAVDTSFDVAAVAVMQGRTLLGEYLLNHKKNHSQKLMPMIKEVMESLELGVGDIDVYAASIGPGSFTGLRIGVTTVKVMAFAAGKPVVGIPTLDALAFNISSPGFMVCPMMDARNNQVYTAVYRCGEGAVERVSDYMGIPVAELLELVKSMEGNFIFVGDGAELHRYLLLEELKDKCWFAPPNAMLHRASSVACLALEKALKGSLDDPFTMVPFYLRKSQAEREREKISSRH